MIDQFRIALVRQIAAEVEETTIYLQDQMQADYATLRGYQGTIKGLRRALEIINEAYRDHR